VDRSEQIVTKELLHEIPKKIGIYYFKGEREGGEGQGILYIGKAKNLYSRVRNYFVGEGDARPFVKFIRSRASTIHTIVVETEQDALLLENELIKKYRPPYNIHLKDDKRFLSIRLDTSQEWPKLEVVRKIKKDRATYLGPFSSGTRLRMTLEFMQKVFPLRTCDDRKLYNRTRPCLEYEIKRCVAPCVNYVTKEDYDKLVQSTILFLKGQSDELVNELGSKMTQAAENERFEDAARIRDQIEAIQSVQQGQTIIGVQQYRQGLDQDAIGIAIEGARAIITILYIRSGVIFDKRNVEFKDVRLDEASLLQEFIEHYYQQDVYLPHEILVPFAVDAEVPDKVSVLVPRADEKVNFIRVAAENARTELAALMQKSVRLEDTLTRIQKLLSLRAFPKIMDCIDISHHQGAETVASVVRFENGLPLKSGYRKLKLTEDQVDDFESMREVVARRYHSEGDLPNLVVIDGGRGQLSSAEGVFKEKGWLDKFDLVSLAKARDADEVDPLNPMDRERIFKPQQKNPILLREDSAEELLLRYLRDEAHRFAITFHRARRESSLSLSILDRVSGISERLKIKLLKEFGSLEGVQDASDDALLKILKSRTVKALRLTLASENRDDQE